MTDLPPDIAIARARMQALRLIVVATTANALFTFLLLFAVLAS